MDSWIGQAAITTVISCIFNSAFWFLFQRRVESSDKEVSDLKSEVKNLRETQLAEQETRIMNDVMDLERRHGGEVQARRDLQTKVEEHYVNQREFRRVEEKLDRIEKTQEDQNKSIAGIASSVNTIMDNIKIKFGDS